jgi:opacity protein-like surface antigen
MAKWHYLIAPMLVVSSTVTAQEASSETSTKKWQHSIEIYALALNIRGDTSIANLSTDVDVDPSFIMDHLDMGAMLRLEGIYDNQWGYYVDYSFMKLSGKADSIVGNSGLLKGEVDIRQGVLETKGFKRYHYDFGAIDYMVGFRWWDNDIDTKLYSTGGGGLINNSRSLDEDWIDYLIGVRWTQKLNASWQTHASLDIGLGSDTDFTSGLLLGARYQINDWSDLNIAYKSTWVDYSNPGTFSYDTASQGFLVGWAAHF